MDEIERLLELGRMDLEASYPEYARGYFEKVLALDATNREAIDALARIDEILSRRMATPVKPIQHEPAKPSPKVATKRTGMYGLAAILVLAVVVTLVWIAYSMFIEPRREVAVVPTAAAITTEMPKPTLKPLPTPTPAVVTGILFGESIQRQIYSDLMKAVSSNVGDKAYETVAQQWGTTVDVVKAIAVEGFKKNWVTPTPVPPTPTPVPPTPVPPTPTPEVSYEEMAYALTVVDIVTGYDKARSEFAALVWEAGQNPYVTRDRSWQKDMATVLALFSQYYNQVGGLNPPPRLIDAHNDLVDASAGYYGAMLYYQDAIEYDMWPEALERGNQTMELATIYVDRALGKIEEIVGE